MRSADSRDKRRRIIIIIIIIEKGRLTQKKIIGKIGSVMERFNDINDT